MPGNLVSRAHCRASADDARTSALRNMGNYYIRSFPRKRESSPFAKCLKDWFPASERVKQFSRLGPLRLDRSVGTAFHSLAP
jgi:hypothetical protein